MGLLDELKEISSNLRKKEELEKELLKAEEIAEQEADFTKAMTNLPERLKAAAMKGDKKYTVYQIGVFKLRTNFHEKELDHIVKSNQCGNYYVAFHTKKVLTQEVLKKHMKGAFRRIFEECEKMELNPTIRYWDDGCGMECGFGIYIDWSLKK